MILLDMGHTLPCQKSELHPVVQEDLTAPQLSEAAGPVPQVETHQEEATHQSSSTTTRHHY
jgi:hypothetical protein